MHGSIFQKFCLLTTVSLSLIQLPLHAETAESTVTIAFQGSSTLHAFEGRATTQPFMFNFEEDANSGQLRLSATAILNVLDMTTDHGKRDKNMFKLLDQATFSLIKGSLTDAVLPIAGSGVATLQLTIRNIEQEIEISVSNYRREGDQVSCQLDFPVSLAAFNLKPPSVMGVIKVGDTVNVECILQGTIQ